MLLSFLKIWITFKSQTYINKSKNPEVIENLSPVVYIDGPNWQSLLLCFDNVREKDKRGSPVTLLK